MKYKDCNYRAVKAKQEGAWTLSNFETLEQAQSWVTPCDHYAITDIREGQVEVLVESKNWNVRLDCAIWQEELLLVTEIEDNVVHSVTPLRSDQEASEAKFRIERVELNG